MTPVTSRLSLRYQGNDADLHLVDTSQLSRSMAGFSRLYSRVAHYCIYGEALKSRQHSRIRCYSAPAKEGSHEAVIVLAALANEYQLFASVYQDAIDWLVGTILGHIKDVLTGRGNMDKLVETISAQAHSSAELNTVLAHGLIKANGDLAGLQEKLIESLPILISAATPSYREALHPVGKSCAALTQFPGTETEIHVTEADALAIRSDSDLVVGDAAEFSIHRIESLSLNTGLCRLFLEAEAAPVTGKIVDPALKQPDNAYSRALNAHSSFKVRAKPVYRDDALYRLYISEA